MSNGFGVFCALARILKTNGHLDELKKAWLVEIHTFKKTKLLILVLYFVVVVDDVLRCRSNWCFCCASFPYLA